MSDQLLRDADLVDVLDVAGRMVANPSRAMVSRAALLAMAHSVERMWEICVEANVLVHALAMAMPCAGTDESGEQAERVALQACRVRDLLAAMSGPQPELETTDACNDF